MAFYIDSKRYEKNREGYAPLINYAFAISDKLKAVFRTAHPGSYLANSIYVQKPAQVVIWAPRYNMIGFMKGERLKFDDHGSYACELDEEGSKIAIRRTNNDGSRSSIVMYQQVGNWIGYAEQYARLAIQELETKEGR